MTNRVVNQKQWFRENLYENIVFTKPDKRKKIKNTDFKIPQYHEWEMLLKINFNCSQLKKISKHYKQKVSGNKNDLSHRLINYLKEIGVRFELNHVIGNILTVDELLENFSAVFQVSAG